MADFDDLCCDHCGSRHIEHFQGEGGQWHNRCQGCGRVTEYIPTRAEIAAACESIRAARAWQGFDDADERLLRLAEAVLEGDAWEEGEDDLEPTPPPRRLSGTKTSALVRRAG